MRVTGRSGLYSPHCARVQPADLVAGLAEVVARAGVLLYEATPVASMSAGRARTQAGDVRAPYILRCTEGFTADIAAEHRTLLPMNSSMIVTGPLSDEAWKTIGWDGFQTLGDEAHAYICAQRTRTAGSRSAAAASPTAWAPGWTTTARSPVDDAQLGRPRRMFPAAAQAGIEPAWCGVLGCPGTGAPLSPSIAHRSRLGGRLLGPRRGGG